MLRTLASLVVVVVLTAACQSDAQVGPEGASAGDEPAAPVVSTPAPVAGASDVSESDEQAEAAGASQAEPTQRDQPDGPGPSDPAPRPGIELVPVAGGLRQMTNLATAGDDRLFITLQAGQIVILADGDVDDRPFLDISDRTDVSASERGLLDVAFHPNFDTNGLFYVNYTDRDGNTVISRFEVDAADPDRAMRESESVLLELDQPFRNHNGGQIEFGPDGFLYVAMGDGGSSGDPLGNGQDPTTLLGAILRIDVDGATPYGIPTDNPFVGDDTVRDEIWAYGVRNPWGFSFDSATGDLWFGDVGQDEFEEVNRQPAGVGGQNYGWNVVEAFECFRADDCDDAAFAAPQFAYDHGGGACSVTGGIVYRGPLHPDLDGLYFFGDLCAGSISAIDGVADGGPDFFVLSYLETSISPVAFETDLDGNLYMADRLDDTLYRIEPVT